MTTCKVIIFFQNVADTANVETDYCTLKCPLSGTRIHHPVRIDVNMKQGPFDRENILAKIKSMLFKDRNIKKTCTQL